MTNLSQTDICNLALMRLGQRKIQGIVDQSDGNAIACNVAWAQAVASVSRLAPWNCVKARAYLGQIAPGSFPAPANPPGFPATTQQWTPGANYAVNAYVTFGYPEYIYQCLIANTASQSFTADLTLGYWFQTTYFSPNFIPPPNGAGTLYDWNYGYTLPSDFLRLVELNGNNCWAYRNVGSLYEIYGAGLFCNTPQADAKYIHFENDTTKFDSLFVECLTLQLASMIATTLRKDAAEISQKFKAEMVPVLSEARTINGAESKPRRYNIVSESRFVRSRRRSTNG